jgi:hypothetical protein
MAARRALFSITLHPAKRRHENTTLRLDRKVFNESRLIAKATLAQRPLLGALAERQVLSEKVR